ncbi:MAG TPA: cell division protein SepF [Acidimicrobiia bacterium]|nr:cell division protein SepF [Acidimicrobiia bacterium]
MQTGTYGMASLWRRAMVYLGLQDDDEYGYDQYGSDYGDYGDHDDDVRPGEARHDPRDRDYEPREERYSRDVRDVRDVRDLRDMREIRTPPEPYGNEPTVRTIPRDEPPSGVSIPRPAVMRTATPTTAARVHVVEPHGFNDAQEIGDRLKANQPVIINLQGVGRDLQRRLIDFSSGLAYGIGGQIQKAADQVFLLTPSNVEVSQEEKERLQARGLYRT